MRSLLYGVRSVVVILLLAAFIATPFSVEAAPLSARERQVLLVQIERLLKQIATLQAQLNAQKNTPLLSGGATLYRSRFFDVPLEAIYEVRDNRLHRLDLPGGAVRPVDQQLFTFFQSVIGPASVRRFVDEFRVFYGDIEELSAFVETKGSDDEWIVAVNRADFDLNDELNRQSFADLFVHEYAHLLFLDDGDLVEDYRERFWSAADERHSKVAADARDRWAVLERYYAANPTRFVSDYATMSVDEDMAESFLQFVVSPKPSGTSLRDKKVLYFYTDPAMLEVRAQLRGNLRVHGII